MTQITPQAGFQMQFLSSDADIVIGGGAAGVGKTFALLSEALRHTGTPNYGVVIFRRTTPQIRLEGGLWDSSTKLFMSLRNPPKPNATSLSWTWQNEGGKSKIQFRHFEHEKTKFDFQGSEIPLICFDELTHFTRTQFFYLLSRNRSTCGVKPYIRCTTNPQPHGWVKDLISWWLYADDHHIESLQGYPVPERAGKKRYFTQDGDKLVWGNTAQEVVDKCPHIFKDPKFRANLVKSGVEISSLIKSLAFVPGSIYDNQKLLSADPAYLGNLMAMSEDEKARLLSGCWKVKDGADQLFSYSALSEMFYNDFVRGGTGRKDNYLTCDIAMDGSDRFVIGAWDGWRLHTIFTMDKSDGGEVLTAITDLARRHNVPRQNIIFDSDGVGRFLKGSLLKGAANFVNGASPLGGEKYENLKTQCWYYLAEKVNDFDIYIIPTDSENMIIEELHAHRKAPFDGRKKRIIQKSQIKTILGRSPDIGDMIMMRAYGDLRKIHGKVGGSGSRSKAI